MVTSSLKAMLNLETKHQVHCFNVPKEALAQLEALKPDVIISDFSMPDMDGITFLQKVKEVLPESTLILLTGYADKENAIRAINTVGIYRYIEKPWDNEELKLNIDNGLERTRLIGDLRTSIEQLSEAQAALQKTNQHLEALVEERTLDLQVAHRKLQSIINNAADGILTLNATLKVTSTNPATERWCQASIGQSALELPIDKVLSINGEESLAKLLRADQPVVIPEARIGKLPVEVSVAPIPEEGGFVLAMRDITQRKEVERLRDDFVSTLTHDLRTPLLAAIQTLGLFLDGSLGTLSRQQEEMCNMLIASHRDMLGLVNVLLEVYKYEAGQQKLVFQPLDIANLVQTVTHELQALAQNRNQTLSISIPKAIPSVFGDRQELRRVFINLIGNAINYTQAGGEISVYLETQQANGKKQVVFSVTDNGRGIPEKDIPQLFQRFSQGTSKKRSSGSGLGLYLSRQIIDAHQGEIGVESQEGKGSRFYLALPVHESDRKN